MSAGELLRAEMNREGSKYGKMIMEINQAGKINPSWLTGLEVLKYYEKILKELEKAII